MSATPAGNRPTGLRPVGGTPEELASSIQAHSAKWKKTSDRLVSEA